MMTGLGTSTTGYVKKLHINSDSVAGVDCKSVENLNALIDCCFIFNSFLMLQYKEVNSYRLIYFNIYSMSVNMCVHEAKFLLDGSNGAEALSAAEVLLSVSGRQLVFDIYIKTQTWPSQSQTAAVFAS